FGLEAHRHYFRRRDQKSQRRLACRDYFLKQWDKPLFLEPTEAKWSPKPIGRKVVTHNRLFVACVHRPHSLDKLGFAIRHALKLSQMLRPRAYEHFCPESSGMFEVLV